MFQPVCEERCSNVQYCSTCPGPPGPTGPPGPPAPVLPGPPAPPPSGTFLILPPAPPPPTNLALAVLGDEVVIEAKSNNLDQKNK